MPLRTLWALLSMALLATWAPLVAGGPRHRTRIELKDGFYYLDGRKFLVNALGYESGARPGEVPYGTEARNLAQIREDLKTIKAAGFNGIRTWSQMSEAELKVVQASGLKVVFGIWLKPDEDFSDPEVVARDLDLIRRVLTYSRNYDCIITYLIMNEPMPEHLHRVGAQATRDLWAQAVRLIHQLHPGIPVSISGNTAITEWLDMNLFDVYGRNAYDYRDGANFTHGFAGSQRAITESLGQGKPVLLTEFGRSVSRRGSNLYGGNTLQAQAEAMVAYYRDALDAGISGLCPFYFADGWWKGGEPAIHNDEAEEWFGCFGFASPKDTRGYPRPAWHALTQYNRTLLVSPRNQAFYQDDIPIEAFCQPEVRQVRVVWQDAVRLVLRPEAQGHCLGHLAFPGEPLTDRELVFESYDAAGHLVKQETILLLTGPEPIQWPSLEIATDATDLAASRTLSVAVTLHPASPFTVDPELRLAFSPHKGWDRAETRTVRITPGPVAQTFSDTYPVPPGCVMLAVYAGVDVRFGKFVRTLGAHRYLYRGAWADPIRVK